MADLTTSLALLDAEQLAQRLIAAAARSTLRPSSEDDGALRRALQVLDDAAAAIRVRLDDGPGSATQTRVATEAPAAVADLPVLALALPASSSLPLSLLQLGDELLREVTSFSSLQDLFSVRISSMSVHEVLMDCDIELNCLSQKYYQSGRWRQVLTMEGQYSILEKLSRGTAMHKFKQARVSSSSSSWPSLSVSVAFAALEALELGARFHGMHGFKARSLTPFGIGRSWRFSSVRWCGGKPGADYGHFTSEDVKVLLLGLASADSTTEISIEDSPNDGLDIPPGEEPDQSKWMDLCTIQGLELLTYLHINNGVKGSLSHLRNLTRLEHLEMTSDMFSYDQTQSFHNGVGGALCQLGSLTNLQSLDLNSSVVEGDIIALQHHTMLTHLGLANTEITGARFDFSLLTNLERLTLAGCPHLTLDMAAFTNALSLKSLILSDCTGITGSLEYIRNLTNLTDLVIHNTRMPGCVSDLHGMTSLNTLYANFSRLAGDIAALGDLRKLRMALVRGTMVHGDLNSLPELKKLMTFDCFETDVTAPSDMDEDERSRFFINHPHFRE